MAAHAGEDGRVERGRRSREAVAEAMLALINEGHLRPVLRTVAERAGVSLRLVHNHFDDREQLFAAAAQLQMARMSRYVTAIAVDLPFDERLDKFIAARTRLLEVITPVRRAAVGEEPFSTVVAAHMAVTRDAKRKQVMSVFARELDAVPRSARKALTRSVCAVASWSMWEQLRAHQGLSRAAARRAMTLMMRTLLTSGGKEST